MANETRSITEVVPYVGIVALGFLIAGYLSFALFNGLTQEVYPWGYDHFTNPGSTFAAGWVIAWGVAGTIVGVYYGRK
ncbi:MAG: hypothetical protein ACLFSW_02565 [Halobacteriales archaeon]